MSPGFVRSGGVMRVASVVVFVELIGGEGGWKKILLFIIRVLFFVIGVGGCQIRGREGGVLVSGTSP